MISKEGKILRGVILGGRSSKKAYFHGEEIIVILPVIKISIMSVKILTENTAGNETLIEGWRVVLIYQCIFFKSFLLN